MDYNQEEFIIALAQKTNIIKDTSSTLKEKYKSEEMYEQFLVITRRILEEEPQFFILDDSYRQKVYDVIGEYRFKYRKKELFEIANEIISRLNGMNHYTPEQENEIIDQYICWHEDVRELVFTDLQDFIDTISKDVEVYLALVAKDLSSVDDIVFIGATNFFLGMIPEIYQDEDKYLITEKRAKQIKKQTGVTLYKKKNGAIRTLNYLKEIKK